MAQWIRRLEPMAGDPMDHSPAPSETVHQLLRSRRPPDMRFARYQRLIVPFVDLDVLHRVWNVAAEPAASTRPVIGPVVTNARRVVRGLLRLVLVRQAAYNGS